MTGDVMRHVVRLELALLLAVAAAPAFAAEPGPMATQSAVALPVTPTLEPAPLSEAPASFETTQPEGPDGKVHGMVFVGVGTGGYREAAMALHGQLANGAEVAIAVDTVQMNAGRTHRDRALQPPAAD